MSSTYGDALAPELIELVRDVRDLCADASTSCCSKTIRDLDPGDLLERVRLHREIRRKKEVAAP